MYDTYIQCVSKNSGTQVSIENQDEFTRSIGYNGGCNEQMILKNVVFEKRRPNSMSDKCIYVHAVIYSA